MCLGAAGRAADLEGPSSANLRGVLSNLVVLGDERGDPRLLGLEPLTGEVALLPDVPNDPDGDPHDEPDKDQCEEAIHGSVFLSGAGQLPRHAGTAFDGTA